MDKMSVIRDFFIKGYIIEPKNGKVYTSCILELRLGTKKEKLSHIIVRRYQKGEVNSMKYADSVRINQEDLIFDDTNSIYLSTDCLGYGKSVETVTYFISVTVVLKNSFNKPFFYVVSDTICAKTPDGNKLNDVYKEV